jgi:hypothetical protein
MMLMQSMMRWVIAKMWRFDARSLRWDGLGKF